MKIIFNDATELIVQQVYENGDYLNIKTISAKPADLRTMFEDQVKTKKMIVDDRGKQTVYEGYTSYYRSEEYRGGIYGVVMYKPEKVPEVQQDIVNASILVAQIQAQSLTDEQALSVQAIYPQWDEKSVIYPTGHKVLQNGVLYKCLQEHTSQSDWGPEAAPSLWTKVLIPDSSVVPEWEQPNSTNGYSVGDRVMHNGVVWESQAENNVWEPGTIGTESLWVEVTE